MIVKMRKIHAVTRRRDRDRLIESIGDFGAVHLAPVAPVRAVADEGTLTRIESIERAVQILSAVAPAGPAPDIPVVEAAQAVLDIQRRAAEGRGRLAALHRQLEQMRIWGDVRLEQIEQLREAGIDVQFFSVPFKAVKEIEAECVQVIRALPAKRALVAVIDRRGRPGLPDRAMHLPLPPRDAPSIRGEAAEIDAAMKQDVHRLASLAHLTGKMKAKLGELREQAEYTIALRSALDREPLFAIQGWVPAEKSESLAAALADAGIDAAVETVEPAPGENPPTLIRYPHWTKPIEGLFKILGTVAGYREFDVSAPFMIALPIFAAMLISDGGYGALLCLGPLLFYRQTSSRLGAQFTQLLIIVGAVALVWGFLCGSFFGITPYPPPIPVNLTQQSRFLLMSISFTLGAIHLSLAQIWQAVWLWPDLRFLNKVGWAAFIWGMLGVVRMFVLQRPMGFNTPWPYLLIFGAALAIVFSRPSRNIIKTLGLGIADFPFAMLSAFSDVISYVRLMAVGLASSVLATNFNELALGMKWPVAAAVLLFGHSLNLGLALIALFAHGVRLNMLEFSNSLGMQWAGYPYSPFFRGTIQENRT